MPRSVGGALHSGQIAVPLRRIDGRAAAAASSASARRR